MFKNYLTLALRVLTRRKFFTFISLFGISFTLGILMVLISFLDSSLGENPPLSDKGDMVFVSNLNLARYHYDSTMIIDTNLVLEEMVFDTSYDVAEAGSSNWNSSVNNGIFQNYFDDLSSSRMMTIFNSDNSYVVFKDEVKLEMAVALTDANYWKVFDHQFLEGRSFDDREVQNAAPVVVITDEIADEHFGRKSDVLGEEIVLDGKSHKIIGVFKHIGKLISFVSPDAVIPYTHQNLANQSTFYHGSYSAIFLAKDGASTDALKEDIEAACETIPLDHPDNENGYTEAKMFPASFDEMFARGIYYDRDASKSLRIMKWALFGILAFFVILPTLNLINLNISRILERSSEIGVRKAFGASSSHIMGQFIIENIIQTLIGGVIGLVLAILLIYFINSAELMGRADLMMNWKFFVWSFLITLLFGVLSGLLPSLKMSKMQIVKALKETQL